MSGLLARYEKLIETGELRVDADQRKAAVRLDRLQKDLEAKRPGSLITQFFNIQ